MNSKKVDEIMERVIQTWTKKFGKNKIDPEKVEMVRQVLTLSPHEDGIMRVECSDGFTHLVPIETIILEGLTGTKAMEYPIEVEV
jgi:hypothetical protein